ncbi:hypothetical protein NQ314_004981 [Rhamnusium bicolor]|uniref:DNA2/NAM7 helicase-like C-terminal domain-containing protein n=1 Tax=Rhamnusium bicolor TaxID=1586634 RepID=A0AAV8ZI52_9CUCU|nr:hypothetical protein NQ314_004981 [Rhamnusium bicolor]
MSFELLEDKRRLTVAITRAKHKLIVVGDVATLNAYSIFRKFISYVEQNIIKLEEVRNFDWEAVLDISTKVGLVCN